MTRRITILSLGLAALIAAGTATAKPVPTKPGPAKPTAAANRVEISITRRGFAPDHIEIKQGEPVVLAFTRKTDATCAKTIVVDLGGGKRVQKDLPLDQTVEISAKFGKTGELTYSCGMDMIHGVMTVN